MPDEINPFALVFYYLPLLSIIIGIVAQLVFKKIWVGPAVFFLLLLLFMLIIIRDTSFIIWALTDTFLWLLVSFIISRFQSLIIKK